MEVRLILEAAASVENPRSYCNIEDICLKLILNSNFIKSCQSGTSASVVESFWKFAQSTAVSLSCSAQIFGRIWQLKWMYWVNEISRDFDFSDEFWMDVIYCNSAKDSWYSLTL